MRRRRAIPAVAGAALALSPLAARATPGGDPPVDDGSGFGPSHQPSLLGDPVADREPPRPPAPVERDPEWYAGRDAIALVVGAAAPTGIGGVEVERDLERSIALRAGVGLGRSGPQLSVGARYVAFRPALGLAYLVGGGLSYGDADAYDDVSIGGDYDTKLHGALWLDVDNALEVRWHGWSVRPTIGFGVVLAARGCEYDRAASGGLPIGNPASSSRCTFTQRHLVWPSLALAIGRAF